MANQSRTAIMLVGWQHPLFTAEPIEEIMRRIDTVKSEFTDPMTAPMVACTMVSGNGDGFWTTPAAFNVASVVGTYETRPSPDEPLPPHHPDQES